MILNPKVWRLWVRESGAANAIAFALRQGFTREQILAANRVWLAAALLEANGARQ